MRTSTRRLGTSTSASAAVLFLGLLAAPATYAGTAFASSPGAGGTADAGKTTGRHCAVNVDTEAVSCYATFREAIAKATGGRITDGPEEARTAAADAAFERQVNTASTSAAAPAATTLISIEYQHPDYKGETRSMYGTRGSCTSGATYKRADIRTLYADWNDKISSFKGQSGCRVNHYEHSNYGGAQTGYKSAMKDMGLMEDKTTSLRWAK
ncbi:peptidase inhibitor family I36 protein [Streptomyces sp. NPDC088124]|uniref:peptidase inhibitor family I36 protein n=1 Tax=Streptomyces sp. NPDC088124 TaxID=3154654 RepID=UPI003438C343